MDTSTLITAFFIVLQVWQNILYLSDVAIYIRPSDGEGIKLYINGAEVVSGTTKTAWSQSAGKISKIVVGKFYTYRNLSYLSVQIDELTFFNNSLTAEEILLFAR